MLHSTLTDNYRKHTSSSFLQRYLIDRFLTQLINQIKLIKPRTVLDVGCGEGFVLKKIKTSGAKAKLEGIEYLDEAIKLGRKINPDIKIRKGSIYNLPYKDNSFDLVICTEVLEHLEDPFQGLIELVRVSKKNIIVSVPNEPFFMLANFIRGKNLSRWGNDIEHINHWTFLGIKSFLRNSNLKIVGQQFPFPWSLITTIK